MNPKHPELLKAALRKFEFLTYRQIFELFRGQIHGRSVERCIALAAKSRIAQRHQCTITRQRVYSSHLTSFLALEGTIARSCDAFVQEFRHREACTDVIFALARRSFVSQVLTEREIKLCDDGPRVIGRRPDGFFTLERGNDLPIDVALEVETTLRNRKRIAEVVERYVETFVLAPDRLSGVVVVAATPGIAHAYREALEHIPGKHGDRFLISEKLDLSDVKESILGRVFETLSDHPKSPLLKSTVARPPEPFKAKRTISPAT